MAHGTGCGMASTGEPVDVLRRVMGGYARHANFCGILVIGLGCESNQISSLLGAQNLKTTYTCEKSVNGGAFTAIVLISLPRGWRSV